MSFSTFMIEVPALARLLIAVVLTAGISVVMVRVFHRRIVAFTQAPRAGSGQGAEGEDPMPAEPGVSDLSGRVMGLIGTAFVFLLAFTLAQSWGNGQQARSSVNDEAIKFSRATLAASFIPQDKGGDLVRRSLEDYRASVLEEQWPLLQRADVDAVSLVQERAVRDTTAALAAAYEKGAGSLPEWGALTGAVSDMGDDGSTRIQQLPGRNLPGVLLVIVTLGLANLVLTAVFVAGRLRPSMVLIGVMATITALLIFLVVEASNPYAGAAAVRPSGSIASGQPTG